MKMKNNNRRDQIDSHSVASMSSKPSSDQASADRITQRSNSLGQRKPPPWYSLRRIINDIQRQRFGGPSISKKSRQSSSQPRSVIVDVEGPSVVSRASYHNTEIQPIDANKSCTLAPIDDLSMYTSDSIIECPLCTLSFFYPEFFKISACKHLVCHSCMNVYLTIEIAESRINIACPICSEKLHPNEIKVMLDDEVTFRKYEQFMVRRVLANDPDSRWCPAPDCSYAVIATGCASCPKITCERPGCGTTFCYHCKQFWHPNQTCDSAKAERLSNLRSSSFSFSQESANASEIKPCPRCQAFIIKMDDGSCNHMTCAICGAEFCWLCMKEISDLHYLSPSGCTFWGKKPWSRKKKILWQLGTLIGAPVGIVLIAGISVPAIIIGLPIWVGKKIYGRCSHMTVHKRNLAIAGGVISSILISPLLAALVVGIGVPILLAYVYGVVPISLCRSGGCGVKTTNTGKVKIDFDEAYAPAANGSGPFQDKLDDRSGVVSMGHHVTNPSIGPSIGEMSLATNSLSASGSHIDRIGISAGGILGAGVTGPRDDSCDRDSASHLAMAGSCGVGQNMENISYASGGTNVTPCANRMEVQVEISLGVNRQRCSISSESASLIDTKSVSVSFNDAASGMDVNSKAVPRKDLIEVCPEICSPCGGASSDGSTADMTMPLAPRACFHQRYGSPPPNICPSRNVSFKPPEPTITGSTGAMATSVSAPPHRGPTYCKRHSMSVGDSIDEERTDVNDFLSVHSLASNAGQHLAPIPAILECCPGGSDIVAMVAAEGDTSDCCYCAAYHNVCLSGRKSVDAISLVGRDRKTRCVKVHEVGVILSMKVDDDVSSNGSNNDTRVLLP